MMLNLKPTRMEQNYEVEDAGGYRFDIVAVHDEEVGWSASVRLASRGLKTADSAVRALEHSVRALLRMLEPDRTGRERENSGK